MRISDWSSDVCSSDLAGIIGTEAGALHRRDGDDARRDDVGNHAARDRALQRRGDHADLGGAAAHLADQREGHVVEEPAAAGVVQRHAEDEEADRSEERSVGKEWVSTCKYRW